MVPVPGVADNNTGLPSRTIAAAGVVVGSEGTVSFVSVSVAGVRKGEFVLSCWKS